MGCSHLTYDFDLLEAKKFCNESPIGETSGNLYVFCFTRPGRSSPSAHGGSILKQKHGSEECVEDNVSEGVAKDDMEGVVQVINQGHIDSSVVTPTLHGHAMDTPANTPAEGQESEVLPNASIDASGFVFKLLNEAKSELSAEENEDSARKTDDNVEPNDGHSVEQETEEKKASGDISSDDDDL